jgi:hypothetical protein
MSEDVNKNQILGLLAKEWDTAGPQGKKDGI